jgi:hypothetical protein
METINLSEMNIITEHAYQAARHLERVRRMSDTVRRLGEARKEVAA